MVRKKKSRQQSTAIPGLDTNYDRYVQMAQEWRYGVYDQAVKDHKVASRRVSHAKKTLKSGPLTKIGRDFCDNVISVGTASVNRAAGRILDIESALRDSHVFLVGPATSDSLYRFAPTNYEFIENGRLPFDKCYFELIDGIDITIPGFGVDAALNGIQVSHKGERSLFEAADKAGLLEGLLERHPDLEDHIPREYEMTAYMHSERYGPGVFKVELDVSDMRRFQFATLYLPKLQTRTAYAGINTAAEEEARKDMDFTVSYSKTTKEAVPFGRSVGGAPIPEMLRNMDAAEASKFIKSLYQFGVNMINYVNAHNVTLKQTDSRGSPNGRHRTPHSKPYNLITLRDEVRYVGDDPRETDRHLEYRIYVRGHPRLLRDDDGIVRKTVWVSPHIRGPEDAPWREQRYQVLAAKLNRERELNRYIAESFNVATE